VLSIEDEYMPDGRATLPWTDGFRKSILCTAVSERAVREQHRKSIDDRIAAGAAGAADYGAL